MLFHFWRFELRLPSAVNNNNNTIIVGIIIIIINIIIIHLVLR